MDVNLQKLADDISTLAISVIATEWRAQGHELTGSAVKQMETLIKFEINTLIIEGYVPDYMAINNSGVKANRIPYYPGSGRKESEYIKGLMKYVQQRMGKSEKESKGIAFAIASKHKKEGMPTKNSVIKHSKTGRRTGFIEIALEINSQKFIDLIEKSITFSVEATIESYYKSILNR
mgnify:CR=1 FL=1|tara:strand:+ start:692 stop:1222 length:531 start_codon:yes stop_codon:yes gene_type:complete